MKKTLKLVLPQWQGGMNPNYILGAQLMNVIIPTSSTIETISIPVADPNNSENNQVIHNIAGDQVLHSQFSTTSAILATKMPAKIITVGGDCATSLAPFNYLSTHYKNNLGVLWIDAHPDISTSAESQHLHEMVVSTLMKQGAPDFNQLIDRPLTNHQIMLTGLIKERLRKMDHNVFDYQVPFITPSAMRLDPDFINHWIAKNNFTKIAVHLDLDVFAPDDFRSTYPAEPHTNAKKFPAAVGQMRLPEIFDLLAGVEKQAEIVGFTVAEHMPWDALNLRQNMEKLQLFQD